MANRVTLPRLGQGMESGTIVKWLKSEGEAVEKGDPLYELDTEKVTQEVEADFSGTLLKIMAGEGEEIEVGKPVAVIGEEGEDVSAESDDSAEGEAEDPTEVAEDEEAEEGEPAPKREEERERGRESDEPVPRPEVAEQRQDGGRVKASPLARRIARERGIDLSGLHGTGPEGRIVAEDVERAGAAPAAMGAPAAAPAEAESIPLTGIRKTIARRMTEAWEAPAFQITMTADMSAAIRLREALVERTGEDETRPTYSDILTKVCAVALIRHRAMNALFGGTFTISNLGMYGVERFVAVLNPPQAGILAVGAIEERAVARDGDVVARPAMEMTLTCDHRSVDGATASEFLRTVKQFLQEPGLAL
jgi:pyruvate dehydrogenase E2 component (dihydrolipoamide acetyltransferase)